MIRSAVFSNGMYQGYLDVLLEEEYLLLCLLRWWEGRAAREPWVAREDRFLLAVKLPLSLCISRYAQGIKQINERFLNGWRTGIYASSCQVRCM